MNRPHIGLVVLSALPLVLAGCVLAPRPEFVPPIRWEGSNSQVGTSVYLGENGTADLVEFPQGSTRKASDGTNCLDLSAAERYTGPAEWSARGAYAVELAFGDSTILLSTDPWLGDQDWSAVLMRECGAEKLWALQYSCGHTGLGSGEPSRDEHAC